MIAPQSRAAWPSTSSSSGKIRASGWAARWSRRSDSASVMGASIRSASTPAAAERCQESATSARMPSRAMGSVDTLHRPPASGCLPIWPAGRCVAVASDFFGARPSPVTFPAVACPSGRRCNTRNVVWGQTHRGFKSHRHRQCQTASDLRRCRVGGCLDSRSCQIRATSAEKRRRLPWEGPGSSVAITTALTGSAAARPRGPRA